MKRAFNCSCFTPIQISTQFKTAIKTDKFFVSKNVSAQGKSVKGAKENYVIKNNLTLNASRATNDFSLRWIRELFYIIMRLTFNNKFHLQTT